MPTLSAGAPCPTADMITYEFPLNERIRTLLRLEDLFERARHFLGRDTPHDHHACLTGIFEILEVVGRADLKSDLLQELDRQRIFLEALRANPAISEEKLNAVLGEIERAFTALHASAGKSGHELRENEWLMAVKQRAAIPGGTSEFDLPSYHFWMHRGGDARREDLIAWLHPLDPISTAMAVVLRVLRESARSSTLVAHGGVFTQGPGEKPAQMLRLTLARDYACVPEVSANKYALNIRFLIPDGVQKSRVFDRDVAFDLAFCGL